MSLNRDTKQRKQGLAELAAGSAALGTGLSTNRIANEANVFHERRVDRKMKPLTDLGPKGGLGEKGERFATGQFPADMDKKVKVAAMKRKTAALKDLQVLRKKPVITPGGRSKVMRTGLAVGAPLALVGAHHAFVDKAERRTTHGDVNTAAAGAAAGAATPHAAGLAMDNWKEKGWEARTASSPKLKGILNEHRNKHGLGRGENVIGSKKWRKFYRAYPKSLPGARYKRAASWALTGSTGVGLTATAAVVGGKQAVDARRHRQDVSKQGDYPHLLDNIRADTQVGIPGTRVNPISPLQMLSSSNMVAGGYLKVRSRNPFGRKKRTKAGMYRIAMGSQMGYQPLGIGRYGS